MAEFDPAAALTDYPLPEGADDADMSLEEIGGALGVSTNTVSKWVKAGMPVLEEGGAGRAYVVRLSHAWAWRQWCQAAEAARRSSSQAAVAKMQAALLNLDLDGAEGVSHADLRKMAEADMVWQQARLKRRQLVQLDEVVELVDNLVEIFREGLQGLPDTLERELGLDADQVELVIRAGNDLLTELHGRIEAAELAERELGEAEFAPQVLI